MILVLGKARSHREPNLGCSGAESPGWFDVSAKNSAQDRMYEWAHCCDEAANQQLSIAVAFWIIQIVSSEKCSSLMQNLMQIRCSTCLVILIAMATQYACSLSGVYHPHWLVQWNCHCSCTHIPVHSPWLPGYINVVQTIPVILTMAGLFWTDLVYFLLQATVSESTCSCSREAFWLTTLYAMSLLNEQFPVLWHSHFSYLLCLMHLAHPFSWFVSSVSSCLNICKVQHW